MHKGYENDNYFTLHTFKMQLSLKNQSHQQQEIQQIREARRVIWRQGHHISKALSAPEGQGQGNP